MIASSTNPTATIANNTEVDLDIYDVFSESEDLDSPLTYTKLGTVRPGKAIKLPTRHFASQLLATYSGPIPNLSNLYYYRFPVAVMAVIALGSRRAVDFKVTKTDQRAMEQSFRFLKYVTANADSKIAQKFFDVLRGPKDDKSGGDASSNAAPVDQAKAVQSFFSSTKNFADCTLKSWTAITTWVGQNTSAWQGTYYLYSVPPQGTQDIPRQIAKVFISSTASQDTAQLTTGNGSGTATTLIMNGSGLEEEDIGAGTASVSLQPVWMNVIQTGQQDGQASSQFHIGTGMTGVVDGTKVFGTGEKMDVHAASSSPSGGDPYHNEHEFDRRFNHYVAIIGLAISCLTAYFFYKQLSAGHDQKSNRQVDELAAKGEATDRSVDTALNRADASNTNRLRENRGRFSDAFADAHESLRPNYDAVARSERASILRTTIDKRLTRLETLIEERPPTPTVEEAAERLTAASDQVDADNLGPAAEQLKQVGETIERADNEGDIQEYNRNVLEETREAAQRSTAENEAVQEAAEQSRNEAEQRPEELDVNEGMFEPIEGDA